MTALTSNSAVNTSSSTTLEVTLNSVPAGATLVFSAQWGSGSSSPTSVSDGTNNFTLRGSIIRDTTDNQSSGVWTLDNVSSGNKTITITFAAATAWKWGYLAAVTDRAASAFGGIAQQLQTSPGTGSNGITSGTLTGVPADAVLLGITFDTAGTSQHSAGTGWTYDQDVTASNEGGAAEYILSATAGDYAATFQQTANNRAITHIISLLPSAGTITSGTGSAAGDSTVSGVGVSIVNATGNASGTTNVTGVGSSINESIGNAAGVSSVNGIGVSTAVATGNAAGLSAVNGVGNAIAITNGQSTGNSTVSGVGDTAPVTTSSTGSAAGSSTVNGQAQAVFVVTGQSNSVSTVNGVSSSINVSTGNSQGLANVTGVGGAIIQAIGASAGSSAVNGVGADASVGTVIAAVGSAAGSSTVNGVSDNEVVVPTYQGTYTANSSGGIEEHFALDFITPPKPKRLLKDGIKFDKKPKITPVIITVVGYAAGKSIVIGRAPASYAAIRKQPVKVGLITSKNFYHLARFNVR